MVRNTWLPLSYTGLRINVYGFMRGPFDRGNLTWTMEAKKSPRGRCGKFPILRAQCLRRDLVMARSRRGWASDAFDRRLSGDTHGCRTVYSTHTGILDRDRAPSTTSSVHGCPRGIATALIRLYVRTTTLLTVGGHSRGRMQR